MLDVAELDDLSGVVLLALLTALVPTWQAGGVPTASTVAATLGRVGAKLLLLTAGGILFARYVEGPQTRWLPDTQPRPDDYYGARDRAARAAAGPGPGVVSPAVFGPVVAVVAVTMVGVPLALKLLLR